MYQVFYNDQGQAIAVYHNCTYGGSEWQNQGLNEANGEIPVTVGDTVTVVDGVITGVNE